jgi:hypothetical protein
MGSTYVLQPPAVACDALSARHCASVKAPHTLLSPADRPGALPGVSLAYGIHTHGGDFLSTVSP